MEHILYPNIYFWILVVILAFSGAMTTSEILRNKEENPTYLPELISVVLVFVVLTTLMYLSAVS